jgi:predicted DCC family thiol-disulfide oxidoreductase YuxK
MTRPVTGTLVYDGDCTFCTRSAEWLHSHGGVTLPWQTVDLAAVGLTEEDVAHAAYWLDSDGHVSARGAGAIAAALRSCTWPWRVLGSVMEARPLRPLADAVYGQVALHRHRLPGSTDACRLGSRRVDR